MANGSETLRLTPEALSEALQEAGLSLREFCRLFDVGYDHARRWTYPDTHPKACEPPYWVTPMLYLLSCDSLAVPRCQRLRQENTPEAHNAD